MIPAPAGSQPQPRQYGGGDSKSKKGSKRILALVLCAVFIILAAGGGFFYWQVLENERAEQEAIRLEQERMAMLEIARREQERLEQERLEQERLEQERIAAEQVVVTMSEGMLQATIGPAVINVPLPEGFVDMPRASSDMTDMMDEIIAESGLQILASMIYAEDLQQMQDMSRPFAPPRGRLFTAQVMPFTEDQWHSLQNIGEDFPELSQMFDELSDMLGVSEIEILANYQGDLSRRVSVLIANGDMPSGMGFAPFNLESETLSAFTQFSYMPMEIFGERIEAGMAKSHVEISLNGNVIVATVMSQSIHDLTWTQDVLRNWVEAIHSAN